MFHNAVLGTSFGVEWIDLNKRQAARRQCFICIFHTFTRASTILPITVSLIFYLFALPPAIQQTGACLLKVGEDGPQQNTLLLYFTGTPRKPVRSGTVPLVFFVLLSERTSFSIYR